MSNKKEFVNLHAHTGYSIGDGMGQPSKHIDFAIKNGLNAHAFTDHGNMSNVASAYIHQQKLIKEGKQFKLIFGNECYFVPSIDEWRQKKEQHKIDQEELKKKSNLVEDDDVGTVVEDESETKSGLKNDKSKDKELRQRSHLVLLAKNKEGYKNLCKLTSLSGYGDNKYYYPRIDFDMLKKHGQGIIASSACLGGVSVGACDFWKENVPDSQVIQNQINMTKRFQEVLGKDNYYLELQWNRIPEQHRLNQMLIEVSQKTGAKLISTADCHYPDPKLWRDREIYKKLAQLNKKTEYTVADIPNTIDEMHYQLYPKNYEQMVQAFEQYSKECNVSYDRNLVLGTFDLAAQIGNEYIDSYKLDTDIRLPTCFTPEGKTSDEHLKDLCYQGLRSKNLHNNSKYLERIEYELDVISKRKMSDYFLVANEAIRVSTKSQIPSIGRGSASGCLISYTLGITNIDPIRFELYFERFIDVEGNDWPDIDIDFEDPAKLKEDLALEWKEKYNVDVVPVSNYNVFNIKNLTKDLAKFYDVPFQEVNDVTSKIDKEATSLAKAKHDVESGVINLSYDDCLEFSESFRNFMYKYPQIAASMENLSGEKKNCAKHAGGLAISENMDERLPLINVKGKFQTPFAEGQRARELEPMGFLKFDFLGLSTLVMIHGTIENILKPKLGRAPEFSEVLEFYNKYLHTDVIDFNDQEVYKNIFKEGKFCGIFQFSQKPVQAFAKKVEPTTIDELAIITAIFRPGPLAAKVDVQYLEQKGKEQKYANKVLEEVFGPTKGFLIYQETIAQIANKLAGMTLVEGNKLRKLLVKKGISKEELDKYKDKFINGCLKNGYDKHLVDEIWKNFERSKNYLFSKNHVFPYISTTYQCAWLSTHYPIEFACAYLDKQPEDKKEQAIGEIKAYFDICDIDINNSGGYSWEILNGKIVPPLSSIKGLGDVAISEILRLRPFNTIEELLYNPELDYRKLNIRGLGVLGRSGALKTLMDSRFINRKHFCTVLIQDRKKKKITFEDIIQNCLEECKHDYTKEEEINNKVELTGVYPIEIVLDRSLQSKLQSRCIPPISEHDLELGVSWCVPREIVQKKTGKGSDYYIVKVTDSNSALTEIKCWSVNPAKDKIYINHPYAIKLDYDDIWGFSTRKGLQNWRLLA